MINTLRPKEIKNAKDIFDNKDIESFINESNWDELLDYICSLYSSNYGHRGYRPSFTKNHGWASIGIFWSTLYNAVDPSIFSEMGEIPAGAFAYTDIESIGLFNIDYIQDCAFYHSKLKEIHLSNRLKYIGTRAFLSDGGDLIIHFNGTTKEFKHIKKESEWGKDRYQNNFITVECNDGTLTYGG